MVSSFICLFSAFFTAVSKVLRRSLLIEPVSAQLRAMLAQASRHVVLAPVTVTKLFVSQGTGALSLGDIVPCPRRKALPPPCAAFYPGASLGGEHDGIREVKRGALKDCFQRDCLWQGLGRIDYVLAHVQGR